MFARTSRSRVHRRQVQRRSYSDNKAVQPKPAATPSLLSTDSKLAHLQGAINAHKPSAWGTFVSGIAKGLFPNVKGPEELFSYEPKVTEAEAALYADYAKLTQQQRAPVIELANLRVDVKNAERAELVKSLAAKANKSVDQVSEVEVAAELLRKREEFVDSIDLENTVLFSAKYRLQLLKQEAEGVKKLNPSKEALALLEKEVKKVEEEAANEILVPLEIDAPVFDKVKANLFPSFKGIPATHYLGMLGGTTKAQRPEESELFFDDSTRWHHVDAFVGMSEKDKQAAADAVSQILAKEQPSGEEIAKDVSAALAGTKISAEAGLAHLRSGSGRGIFVVDVDKVKAELPKQAANFGLSELQVAYGIDWATQRKASIAEVTKEALSQVLSLDRETKKGDLYPELRLAGLIPSSHFALDHNASLHVAGNFENLPADATQAKLDKLKFTTRQFTAPTAFRQPTSPFTETPVFRNAIQSTIVDFPLFETSNNEHPNNPRELVVDMKLWKLFNYVFPNLKTPESRLSFMEHYDISPGERTLEWTQSWPPPEHTFVEMPIIKEAEEPSEDGKTLPAQWPKYTGPAITQNTAHLDVVEDHHHHTEVVVVTDLKPSAKLAQSTLQIPK